MESEARPPFAQRHSSQSTSRTNLRAKNTSSKNLTKLAKFSAAHGGARVSMPRNTSKTNLRKNQSETSLAQHKAEPPTPSSSQNARSGSAIARDLSDTLQMTTAANSKRLPAGSSDPQSAAGPAYIPPPLTTDKSTSHQQKLPRSKKRPSKDHTATDGTKPTDQQFNFDGDELFDDEAWEDENVEVVRHASKNNQEPEEREPPVEAHTIQNNENRSDDAPHQEHLDPDQEHLESSPEPAKIETKNSASVNLPERPSIRFNLDSHEKRPSTPPRDEQNTSPSHLERDIQAALHGSSHNEDDVSRHAANEAAVSGPMTGRSTITFKVDSPVKSPESIMKKSDAIAASDSDTSRETVVLATPGHTPSSSHKPTPASDKTLVESPPSKKKPPKKVQIEEPDDLGDRGDSTPSTGPATPAIPLDTTAPAQRTTSFTSVPQYEFLSKNQRDRASTMIQHHPYPPSAWRDNFLNRATPYVNDVHAEYTQKFARRLDRRIEIRLKNVMQFRDPIINAIQRGQESGVITSFELDDSTADVTDTSRYSSGGIGGWFSRLGGSSRRDAAKPSTKERLEAEQLERWERLVDFHDWEETKNLKPSDVDSRPVTAETATAAE